MKMMTRIIPVILILISCNSKPENGKIETIKSYSNITDDKDTMISVSEGLFEYGTSCGYKNKLGDTVIQMGTFEMCFTDTFSTFAFVVDKKLYGDRMVAINRDKKIIFDAYLFDNGSDYISEGLFRIKRNGKIGYASEIGEVIIEAKYQCAYPFEHGKAKVAYDCETINDDMGHSTWKSSNWIYIDMYGNEIKNTP